MDLAAIQKIQKELGTLIVALKQEAANLLKDTSWLKEKPILQNIKNINLQVVKYINAVYTEMNFNPDLFAKMRESCEKIRKCISMLFERQSNLHPDELKNICALAIDVDMLLHQVLQQPDYTLPLQGTIRIAQGFHGNTSHHVITENYGTVTDDSYSLDFVCPEGTLVLASREGVVKKVDVTSDLNYFPKSNEKLDLELASKAINSANFIRIKHADESFADYFHLKKDSALVKVGDYVKAEQPIALSGNTGFSSEPHLHFCVFVRGTGRVKWQSIPIKFSNYSGPLEHNALNQQ